MVKLPTVTSVCKLSNYVAEFNRAGQVEDLSKVLSGDIKYAREFFETTYVTGGMSELLQSSFKRLAGESDQGIFELRQAMGGGKTHNMISLGLLARFPDLKNLVTESDELSEISESVKVVVVNGRDISNKFIWGDIARQLGKESEFRDHWINGAKPMNESDWIKLIGDEPTVILIDELPPYLESIQKTPVGKETLLDYTKYSLSNLFTATLKLNRCLLVIASLETGYVEAMKVLGNLLVDLQNELVRGAKTITPVDLNTSEIYDILRKRLFKSIPDLAGKEVQQIIDAFSSSYKEAIESRVASRQSQQLADEIRISYPFHPAYKDILSLFKENESFRQTRGLIQFSINLLNSVWNHSDEDIYLIGTQHLDFSDPNIRDQLRDIERRLESAMSRDVYDDVGSAHAQYIDSERGDSCASQIAKILFVSSLSDNVDGVRGLPENTVIEYLVAPNQDITKFSEAFKALQNTCWYIQKRDEDRWFFSENANVRKQIEDKVNSMPQDRVDAELINLLGEIFFPNRKIAYTDLAIRPRIAEISLSSSRRTCLILDPNEISPPTKTSQFFNDQMYKNAFCIVSGDGTQMAKAEDCVRRLLAIKTVQDQSDEHSVRHNEIEIELNTSNKDFQYTVISLFNTVWYPTRDGLERVGLDLNQHRENGYINGELAVETALKSIHANKIQELTQENVDGLIRRCEEQLFPAGQNRIRSNDLIEFAATNPRWVWLEPKGLNFIKQNAIETNKWSEEGGYIDKCPPPPRPVIRVRTINLDEKTGKSELEITTSNSGKKPKIFMAYTKEKVLEGGDSVAKSKIRTDEVELWFIVQNSETGEFSEPFRWTGKIQITHDPVENAGKWLVTLTARPECEIRWNVTGINSKEGSVYDGNPIEIDGNKQTTLTTYAKLGSVSTEKKFYLHAQGKENKIRDDLPAIVEQDFQFADNNAISSLLHTLRSNKNISLYSVEIIVGEHDNSIQLRSGKEVAVFVDNIQSILDSMRQTVEVQDVETQVRCQEIHFPDGITLREFSSQLSIDIPPNNVVQPEGGLDE